MEKDTFQLHFNVDTQITYVKKVCDEQTKNHKETNVEIQSGIIPQVLDVNSQTHKLCPVRFYDNYLNHLNEENVALWQTPRKNP